MIAGADPGATYGAVAGPGLLIKARYRAVIVIRGPTAACSAVPGPGLVIKPHTGQPGHEPAHPPPTMTVARGPTAASGTVPGPRPLIMDEYDGLRLRGDPRSGTHSRVQRGRPGQAGQVGVGGPAR